jgi:hypothetical protein
MLANISDSNQLINNILYADHPFPYSKSRFFSARNAYNGALATNGGQLLDTLQSRSQCPHSPLTRPP